MHSPIILVAIGGLVLTVGDIVFKFWVESQTWPLYLVGIAMYIVGLMFLVQSYKFENIAVASAMIIVFNLVSLAIASWLLFDDRLSPVQLVGICFSIIAVLLFELAN